MLEKERFKELTQKYLEYIDVKIPTKLTYERILRQYVDYVDTLSDLPTRSDVMAYREKLRARKLSATTIAIHMVVIRNFYRWFHIEGYGSSVAEGIKSPKIEKEFKRSALTEEQSKKLIQFAYRKSRASIIDFRNYTLVSLMITTGMRTIEVERSDKADISELDGGYVLFVMGKGKDTKNAVIRLSPQVYDLIESYIIMRNDQAEPLFINHKGIHASNRMVTRNIRFVIKEMFRDINIDDRRYSAHSLRHTAATLSLDEGASTDEAQLLLRHSDPATTKLYLHRKRKKDNFYEYKISDNLFDFLDIEKEPKE